MTARARARFAAATTATAATAIATTTTTTTATTTRKIPTIDFPVDADPSLRVKVLRKLIAGKRCGGRDHDPDHHHHLSGRTEPDVLKRLHSHQFFELLYVECGRLRHVLGDEESELAAGDVVLILPGESHVCKTERGEQDLQLWTIAFTAHALWPDQNDSLVFSSDEDVLSLQLLLRPTHSRSRQLRIPTEDQPHLLAAVQRLERELEWRPFGYRSASRALLTVVLLAVIRLARSSALPDAATLHPVLGSVFQYIERHFADAIGLVDVARAVALSPAYLTDLVRRTTGRTVLQWIIERRMAEARSLLLHGDLLLKDVASRVGYPDLGNFIRHFRKMHGVPPSRWRRANRTV